MANKKNHYTFLFIPHTRDRVRQVSLSFRTLLVIVGVLFIMFIMIVYYIIGFQTKNFRKKSIKERDYENRIMRTNMTRLRHKIDSLEVMMDNLYQINANISKISNLQSKNTEGVELSGLSDPNETYEQLLPYLERIGIITAIARYQKMTFQNFLDICEQYPDELRSIPSIIPVRGTLTYRFGPWENPVTSKPDMNEGVYIHNVEGTPIVATANGVVESIPKISREKYYGRCIWLDHGGGVKTFYAHLHSFPKIIKPGKKVKRGEVIGYMGRSGNWTSSVALHYKVQIKGTYVDPEHYFFASPQIMLDQAYH